MDQCFVIQPFDKGKYDSRYADTFSPAIQSASLTPYRVDEDPEVKIPIATIEEQIKKSRICFAEISTDNPNVWYELGFAFASGKEVVMVCSEERTSKFPFDIQHRSVIKYKTDSKTDFDNLKTEIARKLEAYLKTQKNLEQLAESPILKGEKGLAPHEITMLILILEDNTTDEDRVPVYGLKNDMEKLGYTQAASSLAIRSLQKKSFIDVFSDKNNYGEPYTVCTLTQKGETWLMQNQDQIKLNNDIKDESILEEDTINPDDLPF